MAQEVEGCGPLGLSTAAAGAHGAVGRGPAVWHQRPSTSSYTAIC